MHSILGWEDPLEKEIIIHSRKSHGQRSLADNSSWGCKESDTTTHSCMQRIYIFRHLGLNTTSYQIIIISSLPYFGVLHPKFSFLEISLGALLTCTRIIFFLQCTLLIIFVIISRASIFLLEYIYLGKEKQKQNFQLTEYYESIQ